MYYVNTQGLKCTGNSNNEVNMRLIGRGPVGVNQYRLEVTLLHVNKVVRKYVINPYHPDGMRARNTQVREVAVKVAVHLYVSLSEAKDIAKSMRDMLEAVE